MTYAVRRNDDGDLEDLNSPSEAHLDEALKTKGKSLASTETVTATTKPESEVLRQIKLRLSHIH